MGVCVHGWVEGGSFGLSEREGGIQRDAAGRSTPHTEESIYMEASAERAVLQKGKAEREVLMLMWFLSHDG